MSVRCERIESSLWQTCGALLVDGKSAVLADPGITPHEVSAIADRARELGAQVDGILITHAHWDHLTGVGSFPAAEVCMSGKAEQVIASGVAAARIRANEELHGFRVTGAPRCDRVLRSGIAARVGAFTVETLAVPGHTADGLAFRIRAADVLVVGDYLSTYEFPFVYHSTAAYRATVAALAETLRTDPPGFVVAGHGQGLDAARACAIAEEDRQYLHALKAAVLRAVAAGADADDAVAAGAAVQPPRAADANPERRVENGRHQLAELCA
jgi:hydroxyacylglutathione hydrolase